ncbi:RNA polymerase sigma-70 factor [Microbacter margulisiae]|uniref:RNA polymerase sigma-70 factor (ECF subfamily) n=1 Tax=Microbacter margulisiae TaxID=1350067 RepID=A0A7W5DTZ3_9PORP|nr:RNA polymerase sigma-70 factor [Microbacter margulisiae]MBB3188663.1 RNA polymerase sigma-70 factor (ECF subfamily) [Microbacter margulisiae]
MNEQEALLLAQLKAGNDKAYRYLFDHFYVSLCRVANMYVEDHFTAENLVGDLMLTLWEQREILEIHTSLRAYLFTAIRRRCLNYLQEAHVTREISLSDDVSFIALSESDSTPLGTLIEKELEEKIACCVSELPDECRAVFLLSRQEQLSYDAIATKLSISPNTVHYHIKNALATLRRQLKEYLPILIFIIALSLL